MSRDDTCKRVHSFLKSKCQASSLKVPDAWVDGCVSWYRNMHASNTNIQDLLDFVAQQWFLADFQQLNLRSLPINLKGTALVNLAENYVLQLMYVINIGQSAYSQHSKITKGLDSNSEVSADKKIPSKWEPKTKRMLLLHLTDGCQSIQAMEYLPIGHLHLDLIPGTKILIKGPVECRRGVILLRPHNVELLGGEVSDLVQTNAPENVLARIIGKPENANPVYGSYAAQTALNADSTELDGDDEFTSTAASSCGGGDGGIKGRHQPQGGRDIEHVVTANSNLNHQQNQQQQQPPYRPAPSTMTSAREKRTLGDKNKIYPPAKKIQPDFLPAATNAADDGLFPDDDVDMFPDDDDDILLMADMPVEKRPAAPELKQESEPERSVRSRPMSTSSSSSTLMRSSTVAKPVHPVQPRPTAVRPFTYLSAYLRLRRATSGDTVCVKGFVSTIRGKLEIKEGQWRLGATINDGSAALDVDFSPEILERLIGHSPSSLKSMMSTRDEEAKRLGQQALENAKQSLIRLNCLMHIRWPPSCQEADASQPQPVVYHLEEIERRHLEMLQLL